VLRQNRGGKGKRNKNGEKGAENNPQKMTRRRHVQRGTCIAARAARVPLRGG